jgi:hypothetical protein
MPFERWKTKDGSIVEIDSIAFNGLLKAGTVNGTRCIWDSNTGQCWGKDGWDLEERLEDAITVKD